MSRQNVFSYSYLGILSAAAKNAEIRGLLNYCRNHFCPLWILDCKDKAHQKCKSNRKTVILEKYLDFHAARNQGRWSMPKLNIGQYCTIRIRKNVPNFKSFWNCQHGHLSLQSLAENVIFGPRTHFVPPNLIIIGQIQVKLPSHKKLYGKYTLSILHLYFRFLKSNRSLL